MGGSGALDGNLRIPLPGLGSLASLAWPAGCPWAHKTIAGAIMTRRKRRGYLLERASSWSHRPGRRRARGDFKKDINARGCGPLLPRPVCAVSSNRPSLANKTLLARGWSAVRLSHHSPDERLLFSSPNRTRLLLLRALLAPLVGHSTYHPLT